MDQAGQHLNIWMRPWLGPLPARAVLHFGGAEALRITARTLNH